MDNSIFRHVSNKISASSQWKKIEDLCKRKITDNKNFLIRKLINLKSKEGGYISEHLNETQSIMNQLFFMPMILDDEFQALLLFSTIKSLDSSHSHVLLIKNQGRNKSQHPKNRAKL